MLKPSVRKIENVIKYLISKHRSINEFQLTCILFFAEQDHINYAIRPITYASFYTRETILTSHEIHDIFCNGIKNGIVDLDIFSPSDLQCLDKSFYKYFEKTNNELISYLTTNPPFIKTKLNNKISYKDFITNDQYVDEFDMFLHNGVL